MKSETYGNLMHVLMSTAYTEKELISWESAWLHVRETRFPVVRRYSSRTITSPLAYSARETNRT